MVLSKNTFNEKADWSQIMTNLSEQKKTHDNDIYKKFEFLPSQASGVNFIHSQTIFPADEGVIGKYSKADYFIIKETPELYEKKLKKFITDVPVSKKQWVYNILDHDYEKDKVIYRDNDPQTGFIFVIDYGMNAEQKDSLHILAIVNRKDLLSMRDLAANELPLLKKIRQATYDVIPEMFKLPKEHLR